MLVAASLWTLGAGSASAATREYWVAAVPTTWNIVPNERDAIMGMAYTPSQTVFPTVVYRRYTRGLEAPAAATRRAGRRDQDLIPGPLLRARVGDRILVHFKNLDTLRTQPHSMHFHGVHYRPSSDGAYVPGFSGPRRATSSPARRWTYRLQRGQRLARASGPTTTTRRRWTQSIAGGMYGDALDPRPPRARAGPRVRRRLRADAASFQTIDGRAFVGNTPVFRSRVGETVQWDVLAIGSEHHTFHVHGHRWRDADGTPRDTQDGRARRELPRALARGRARARGSTTATSSRT